MVINKPAVTLMTMKLGDNAPDFTLPDEQGKSFQLSAQRGARILLVFYPGDETPVCTKQLCDYRDGIEAFDGLEVKVVGISSDDAESHQQFKARHQLPFTLLTDADLEVAAEYGCKSMLGMRRGLFLVDEAGVIRYQHVEKVAMFRRQRDEVLAAIEALAKEPQIKSEVP